MTFRPANQEVSVAFSTRFWQAINLNRLTACGISFEEATCVREDSSLMARIFFYLLWAASFAFIITTASGSHGMEGAINIMCLVMSLLLGGLWTFLYFTHRLGTV